MLNFKEQIHFYAALSKHILKKYLKLENGIPSSDTILRILARIEAEQLEKVFIAFLYEIFAKKLAENEVAAIDGKPSGALHTQFLDLYEKACYI